jgi:very-short-patch-repair endonuclease
MLDDFLRRHDGVLTIEHARQSGLTKQAINRRIQSGHWRKCSRGVYFVNDRPFTEAARARVAVWSFGDRAAASGLAAAFWHGLTRFAPKIVEVTVPRDSHGRAHSGARVRRRDLSRSDIVERRGLRVTALPLTVIEAAVRRRGGASIVDSALQKKDVELHQLWAAHLRNKGRYGSPAARLLLQAAAEGTRSEAERLFAKLVRRAGITGWRTNYPVGGYRVDFGFPKYGIAVEIDGLAFHSGVNEFQVDRERQNAIALCGWQVLRFTWLDLTAYPERTITVLNAAIRRAGSSSA